MNTRTCHNCGSDQKSSIECPWCDACLADVNTARAAAAEKGEDVGAAQRTALWQRGHNPHRNRADSRTEIQRHQFDAFVERLAVVPGSPNDPRRTGG